jgi:hypothetical protein
MLVVVILATDLVLQSTVSQNSEEEVGLQLVEARLVDSKTSTPPELVIVEDDAGAGPSSPMTAFATFTVIRALIRLQRRIKHRYQKQREDLINELGL